MYLTIALIACAITAASIFTLFYALTRLSRLEHAVQRLTTNLELEGTSDAPPRKRRWLTFRMSTLLVATGCIALLMATIARERLDSNRQAEAANRLQQVGASVKIWDSLPSDPREFQCGFTIASEVEPPPPTWIRYALGAQFGCRAYRVDFNRHSTRDPTDLGSLGCGDEDLISLKDLRGLQELVLDDTNITDAGLSHLGIVTSLRSLSLRNTAIDGSGVHHLRALEGLRHLDLRGTKFQQQHLRELQQLTQLQSICLPREIDADGIKILAKIPSLKAIDLSQTDVSPASLESLRKLPRLAGLVLNESCSNADFLNQLRSFKTLRVLRLGSADLTLEDIKALTSLKQIKDLDLGEYVYSTDDDPVKSVLSSMDHLSFLRVNHTDPGAGFGASISIGFSLPNGQILQSLESNPNQFGGGGFF